ncbi:hypothetical protein PR002_g22343 [Phytophthora rubi]|uniref:CCHC-type domain-containing protein n=1 Tax=Phytophthora rubi TaxID=129364 RepID=A0A6A3IXK7_9STRA|nr:hypothetical protein PR002_g22343 [Phytophthora rubi]
MSREDEGGEERQGAPGEQRTVQSAVERLEHGERVRAAGRQGGHEGTTSTRLGAPRPRSSNDAGESGVAEVGTAAGRGTFRREMMDDLWADEEEDEYKDADEGEGEEEDQGVQAEAAETDSAPSRTDRLETLSVEADAPPVNTNPYRAPPGHGRDYAGYPRYGATPGPVPYAEYVKEEPAEVPRRSPSGFIPLYTGTEKRSARQPVFGWSVGERRAGYDGWGTKPLGAAEAPLPVKTVSPTIGRGPPERTVAPALGQAPHPNGTVLGQPMPPVGKGGGDYFTTGNQLNTGRSYDLSSMVSNVIKVLPMFYSDTATTEKARDFWGMFEAHTVHLPDQSRLLVFRQKLKGRTAERWWNNSTIRTFATLKVRFHNLFLSRTADELWERLQTTKRERGESIEEWGDRVSDLCDSLDYPNPQMRYQLFRRGLRNKRMLATLDSGPARDIPEACEWLLAKEMSRPIEEDDEFPEEKNSGGGGSQAGIGSSTSIDALMMQTQTFMQQQQQQQQQWQQQMMQDSWMPPRSPRNRLPSVSASTTSPRTGGNGQGSPGNGRPARGIRMATDSRTQEGAPVCGRCGYLGHSREACRRQTMSCNRCGTYGHIAVECDSDSVPASGNQETANRVGNRRSTTCFFCREEGHLIGECAALAALRNMSADLQRGQPSPSPNL